VAGIPELVGIGSVFIDDIVLPDGRTYMAQMGGGVVHAMMGAAVWGVQPGLLAVIGNDLPAAIRGCLEAYCDTSGLIELPIPQMRAWQLFEHNGRRREIYRVEDVEPFFRGPSPEQITAAYGASRGHYLLQDFDGIRRWAPHLSGMILWEPLQQCMVTGQREAMRQVLRDCGITCISPNLLEASAVYGTDEPDALVSLMLEDGAAYVALRMGEMGSLVASRQRGERVYMPALNVPFIVDQTGAGNTYCGALLWGLLHTEQELRKAAAYAAVSASFCIETIGALLPATVSLAARAQRLQQALSGAQSY
jgi:sugar/nucleoside kinase (ribokinase family)